MYPLALIIIGGSLMIMLGLPLFIQNLVSLPFEKLVLVSEVNQIEAEYLDVEQSTQHNDEISYLTDTFDALIAKQQENPGALPNLRDETLTNRQWDVLEKVAKGYTYKETGASLYISENTVKYHMGKILEKTNLQSKNDAIRYYYQRLAKK